jgi:hypothetical protein
MLLLLLRCCCFAAAALLLLLLLLLLLFASAQYVEGFLAQPLKDAGFKNVNFTEVCQHNQ